MKTALVIIVFVTIFGIVGRMDKEDAQRIERQQNISWRIEEDSPLWNCVTMGNYQCGKS